MPKRRLQLTCSTVLLAGLITSLVGCSTADVNSVAEGPAAATSGSDADSGTNSDATAPSKPESDAEPKPKSDPEPVAPSAPAAPAALADCETLLPIDQARAEMGVDTVEFMRQTNDAERVATSPVYGPSAVAAFAAATDARTCAWGIPNSDGFLDFTVATIPDAEREQFLAELRASDYVESDMGGVPTFELMVAGVGWGGDEGPVRFAFVGPYVYTTAAFTGATMLERVIPNLQ